MKKNKCLMLGCLLLLCTLTVAAQTDYTSRITNPSFESGTAGWEYTSLSTQDNSVFSIKSGSIYLEKWTGRGGAVGSASLSQTITGLAPGNYELRVAAQNIQEDTPNAAQTGTYIFAGDARTTVTVRDNYTVAFDYVSGAVTIGFVAENASGNWIAVDNFRLTKVGDDLSAALRSAIAQAGTTLGDASGKQAAQLQEAIAQAEAVAADAAATAATQADAIVAMQTAEGVYLRANASEEHPLDLTSLLTNPSFETGDFSGWTQQNMQLQNNSVFSIKQGTYYAEKWISKGAAVGDALVSQRLSDMAPGRYRLRVAAQNIQEDTPGAAQTGTVIFANTETLPVTTRQQYALDFVLTGNELEVGFRAETASGNWLAVDNFRLEYISDSQDAIRLAFEQLVDKALTLADERMNTATLTALQNALAAAQTALSTGTGADDWAEASSQLEAAYTQALESADAFARLADAIAQAQAELDTASATETADYQAAIETARNTYDNTSTTDARALAAIQTLDDAAFAFRVANGSGDVPTVTTDPRFLKGSTWAFGRSTVSGSNILEQGFCWSESPDPKVTDHRTTEYLNQAGRIYWLRDLRPARMYYMRAYAITRDYAVGYGDVIKFSTLPKGTITHWYNNGGDEAVNDRINYAINTAMDYYWNNLTSIHDFGISVTYSPGTPTADCSYGGYMRVGANASYQQPGTIMHEALHGIGVGTHGIWWSGDMRQDGNRGVWLGDRVTEAVRFWDNSTTATITGDDTHLWPYGCNGAQEDTHSDNLYCMMGILAQALNEDGLPASGAIGYALPYYSFQHEDDVKYYIKNEDESHGLRTSYLVENASHQLVWQTMDAEEATQDDAAAWYLSFTPTNQYYQLKNAKSGYYMTYNSAGTNGIRTARHNTVQSADNFHLMRGRVDVTAGTATHRGYYIIHPESSDNPPLLNATSNGTTATAGFNIAKSATTQRWLILTEKEARDFDTGGLQTAKDALDDMIAQIREMAATPHTEDLEGVDDALATSLNGIEVQATASTTVKEIQQLTASARQAGMDFLGGVSAKSVETPFDLTFLIENPDFDQSATAGWTTTNADCGYDAGGVEYYEKTFDFYQILPTMPAGNYELHAYAFQRPGEIAAVDQAYSAGTSQVTTKLYIGSTQQAVKHICDDAQPAALFNDGGWGSDKQLNDGTYVPNCMTGVAQYFKKALYDSSVEAEQASNGNLRIGIRCNSATSYYWTMFDHFRLYFYGHKPDANGVTDIQPPTDEGQPVVYDLQGRRLYNASRLQRGIYIVGGRKVLVK